MFGKKKNKLHRSSINEGENPHRQSMRNSLADPNYKGDDYYVDEEIRNIGPLKSRGCSDVLFCLIFLAFFGIMGWITLQSYKDGKPDMLLAGIDADGKLCGYDDKVKDYGALYFIVQPDVKITLNNLQGGSESNQEVSKEVSRMLESTSLKNLPFTWSLDMKYTPICVKECPTTDTQTVDCYPVSNGGITDKPGVSKSQCQNLYNQTINENPTSQQEVQEIEAQLTSGNMYGYSTVNLADRYCLPQVQELTERLQNATEQNDFLNKLDLNNIIFEFGLDDIQGWFEDIRSAKWVYLYASLLCVVVAIVYCILLKFFAKVIIWLSIIGTILGLVALGLFCQKYHNDKYSDKPDNGLGKALQIAVYVLYSLAGLFFCIILCLFRGIQISIAVLETAAVVIIRNIRILIVPFISCIITFAYIAIWLIGLAFLLSRANIELPARNSEEYVSQFKHINFDGKSELKWQTAVYVFGLFWIAELIIAIFHYSLIVGVCTWYFTSTADSRGNFSLLKGFWWSFRYNLGSLALGSFILAVIWTIRMIFEYFQSKLEKLGGDNSMVKCAMCAVRCCLDCCHRFVKFLNKNAYIQVALTGKNFCSSAMAAFVLALKNSGSFVITNGIGTLIQFLGKMGIATGNTLLSYLMLTQIPSIKESVQSPLAPLVVIFFISYVMAAIFMSVYAITSLTLLQCLYADVDLCNQNDQDVLTSNQRPSEMQGIVRRLKKKD